jgi:hypothetical protein
MQDVWSEPPCREVEQGGQLRLVWRTGTQAHVRLSRVTRAVHNSFSVTVVPPALMDATVSPGQSEEPSRRPSFVIRLSTADAKTTTRLMQRRRMVQERVWQCARLRASILLRRRRASSDMQRGHIADADETIRADCAAPLTPLLAAPTID